MKTLPTLMAKHLGHLSAVIQPIYIPCFHMSTQSPPRVQLLLTACVIEENPTPNIPQNNKSAKRIQQLQMLAGQNLNQQIFNLVEPAKSPHKLKLLPTQNRTQVHPDHGQQQIPMNFIKEMEIELKRNLVLHLPQLLAHLTRQYRAGFDNRLIGHHHAGWSGRHFLRAAKPVHHYRSRCHRFMDNLQSDQSLLQISDPCVEGNILPLQLLNSLVIRELFMQIIVHLLQILSILLLYLLNLCLLIH